MPDIRLGKARASLPEDYIYQPPRRFDDRMIAICPHCEEALTADHDCQDAHDDAEMRDAWGV